MAESLQVLRAVYFTPFFFCLYSCCVDTTVVIVGDMLKFVKV